MQETINKIKAGKLDRDNDEAYAGGFWDIAGEVAKHAYMFNTEKTTKEQALHEDLMFEAVQQDVYDLLWHLYETVNNK